MSPTGRGWRGAIGRVAIARARRAGRMAALVALAGMACATPPKKPVPAVSAASFYWEAAAPGGGKLFLLGSVHIGDGRALELDPRVESAWQRADALVVEVDTHALSPVDALDITNRYGLMPPDQTLRDLVSADTYEALRAYVKKRHFPLEAANHMRPWLLAQVVSQLEYQAAGYDAENGVDAWFLKRAGQKPVIELESIDEQMALFASLPDALQEKLLREVLDNTDDFIAVTHAILRAWEEGDEKGLAELVLGSRDDPELATFYRRVFAERNQRMSERLVALAADGRARFVVVGAGHLIGPEGVPALLAERGFQVKRVSDARVRAVGGTAGAPPSDLAPHRVPGRPP